MKTLVIKFGGTSVMDTNRIRKAAEIVMAETARGFRVVVVVSAMGHTTDHLIGMAKNLDAQPDLRELDVLMTTGEQISSALLAMAIQSLSGHARSFTGSAAGILTDSHFGSARIRSIDTEALNRCLDEKCIPVVAGFQGIDKRGELTTLGRGGSDTTAIAIAAALSAERCDIYTDVKGVYSADPRFFPDAYKLDAVSYTEMFELANNGAQVLNARSVEIAKKSHVSVRVRSTFEPNDEGSLITEKATQLNWFTGIAVVKNQTCVKVEMKAPANATYDAQREFRHERFKTKMFLQKALSNSNLTFETGRSLKNSAHEFSICLAADDVDRALDVLDHACSDSSFESIKVESGLAKISIVASELTSAQEVNAILSLTRAGIAISLVSAESNRLSFLISEDLISEAIKLLHANMCVLELAS